jgi:hypothetical protein
MAAQHPVGSARLPLSSHIICALSMRLIQMDVVGCDDGGARRLTPRSNPTIACHFGIDVAHRFIGEAVAAARSRGRRDALLSPPTARRGMGVGAVAQPIQHQRISPTGPGRSSLTPAMHSEQRDIIALRRCGIRQILKTPRRCAEKPAGAGAASTQILAEQADGAAARALRQIEHLEREVLPAPDSGEKGGCRLKVD